MQKPKAATDRYGSMTLEGVGRFYGGDALYLTARKSFINISDGFHVYPQEIENLFVM